MAYAVRTTKRPPTANTIAAPSAAGGFAGIDTPPAIPGFGGESSGGQGGPSGDASPGAQGDQSPAGMMAMQSGTPSQWGGTAPALSPAGIFGQGMSILGGLSGAPLGAAFNGLMSLAGMHNNANIASVFGLADPANQFADPAAIAAGMLSPSHNMTFAGATGNLGPSGGLNLSDNAYSVVSDALSGLFGGSRSGLSPDDPSAPSNPADPTGAAAAAAAAAASPAGLTDQSEGGVLGGGGLSGNEGMTDASEGGVTSGGDGTGGGSSGSEGDSSGGGELHQGGQIRYDRTARLQAGETVIPRGPMADLAAQLIGKSSIRNYMDPKAVAMGQAQQGGYDPRPTEITPPGQPDIYTAQGVSPGSRPKSPEMEPERLEGSKSQVAGNKLKEMLFRFA